LVSQRLVELVGARSGVWIPMIAEERVVGVLVLASTDGRRTFPAEELAVLQAVAAEAALGLERLRSATALSDTLEREQRTAQIVRAIRAQQHPDDVVRVARDELRGALMLDGIAIDDDEGKATVHVERAVPLTPAEQQLV